MCGITGFCNFHSDYMAREDAGDMRALLTRMRDRIAHRGPDARGSYFGRHAALGHVRLSVMDVARGAQPMRRVADGKEYVLIYNGEIYNADEVRLDLFRRGCCFETTCDTEVLLYSYIFYGEDCLSHLNGIFAFALWDEARDCVFLARDRLGVKPLFYALREDELIFGSEIKALLCHPAVKPVVTADGLCEVLGVGPGRTCGCGVFEDVHELRPGEAMRFDADGVHTYLYWQLKSEEHREDFTRTLEHTRQLLKSAVKRQLKSDVPLCTFLSGGLDSSILTAYAALHAREEGRVLSTYSFDYRDNERYFHASNFQPDSDAPYARRVSEHCHTEHTVLTVHNHDLPDALFPAMCARDLPGMADVDASLLLFLRSVRARHVVALSGECADEVFGGYPWFHRPQYFEADTFPWNIDPSARYAALDPALVTRLHLEDYVHARYTALRDATPPLEGENVWEARRRQISFMNLYGFMQTLLERKDRMSMACGLEVRVPFCDHTLLQYVFNVPWEMKCFGGEGKGLLRAACAGLLPEEILHRKKSPYPKTHNPLYEQLLHARMQALLSDPNAPVHALISRGHVAELLTRKGDLGKPWFGQLMAAPQLIAWLLQLNDWLRETPVTLRL